MATTKGKGFAGIQDAAGSPFTYEQMRANERKLGPTGPSGPITAPTPPAPGSGGEITPEVLNQPAVDSTDQQSSTDQSSPYTSQPGEHEDTGHAHLMQDLGTAIQEMMKQDPDTHKSMSDLMEEFMGKGVDYDSEGKRLQDLIQARKTPKAPNWVAAGVGSWAGGPAVASKFSQLQQAATGGEEQKQQDLEDTQRSLLKEHVEDLRSRGKTKEALLMGLMSGAMKSSQADKNAQLRLELQDRSLGAAEQRVRLQIESRHDIADKDRTAGQVMHLYESLLKQNEKDVTGATKPLYSAKEAMDMALNTVLPKVKAGVEAVKTGEKPATDETAPPATTPTTKSGSLTFTQWKAQQAAGKAPAKK